jgi:serine/threonine-protein kinase RsbW
MTHAQASATGEPVDLSLPFEPQSAHVARDTLVSWLATGSASAEQLDDARLVVSELVGNAVRHARPLSDGTMQVTWTPEDSGLVIAVSDGGAQTTPEITDSGVSDLSGRGLSIVEALSARWWVETTRTRTTVHALVPLS